MILVELFSVRDSPACAEALSLLGIMQQSFPLTLREHILVPGDQYYDEYHDLVPVVHINRVPAFRHRLPEGMLRIRLQQAATERDRPLTEEGQKDGEITV